MRYVLPVCNRHICTLLNNKRAKNVCIRHKTLAIIIYAFNYYKICFRINVNNYYAINMCSMR